MTDLDPRRGRRGSPASPLRSVRRAPAAGRLWLAALLLALPALRDARAEKVPEIAVGPATLETAQRVDARLAEVTVYSDRARVRRRGRISGAGSSGIAVVRLPDLPGAVWTDTVRVSATGARVLRVEARPVERERRTIEQASKLLDELDEVNDRLAALLDLSALDDWELAQLGRLAPAAPVPEDKREGRKALVVDAGAWTRVLDFLAARGEAARGRVARAPEERRPLEERRDRLRAEVAKLNQGGFSERLVEVVAVLEGAGAAGVELELEYFLPGARWRPTYDLHFAPARGQLRLETAALVEQATGEDWNEVTLSLSTAVPGRGIDAPELLTWTLGEKSEFVPQLRARYQPPLPPAPPPVVVSQRPDSAREALAESVRARIGRAAQGLPAPQKIAAEAPPPEEELLAQAAPPRRRMRVSKSLPAEAQSYAGGPAPSAAAPSMARMAAESAPESDQSEEDMAGTVSRSRAASSVPVTQVPLALFDRPPRSAPVLTDPLLPAVSAGGLDYVYPAPTAATVPSSGRQIRIPLAVQTFRAAAYHQATPALATTAFLRARVRNDGKRPLLRGPTTIFSDGELVGQGEIKTTGPGGEIELPLGADQDIRLVRQVVPSTRTTGLIIKVDETTYDVQIQVGNYKKQPASIEVADQLPRSAQDKVEVKLLGVDPPAQGPPDADGVVRWRVDLAAGATRTLRLRYQINRPKNWELYQR